MKRFLMLAFLLVLFIADVQGCHDFHHLKRRKRSVEFGDATVYLINFFTDCMTASSNISLDWYSVTDWTVEDSNWYYYTDSSDCAGEFGPNETSCWMERVDIFLNESLSPAVKECIQSYATASGVVDEDEEYESAEIIMRRKRQAGNRGGGGGRNMEGGGNNRRGGSNSGGGGGGNNGGGTNNRGLSVNNNGRGGGNNDGGGDNGGGGGGNGGVDSNNGEMNGGGNGEGGESRNGDNGEGGENNGGGGEEKGENKQMPPPDSSQPKPLPPRPPRNSECPDIPSNYRQELMRLVPSNFRPPKPPPRPRRKRSEDAERGFDIISVVDFIDEYTVCNECERYSGGSGIACFTDRFDRLTRYDSSLKSAIQRANARYAGGQNIIGNCRDSTWTDWFNIDNPVLGEGDFETLEAIKNSYPSQVCNNPSGIQAELSGTNLPYGRGGNSVEISPDLGLICQNSQQSNGTCRDYRIRFCCSDYVGSCPLTNAWTKFFDESNPNAVTELELLTPSFVRQNMGRVCKRPTAIGARVVSSNTSYQLAGDTVHLTPSSGLLCFSQQQNDGQCEDYQVRYCCPATIGKCARGHQWTLWYQHRLQPFGDDESLVRIRQRFDYPCLSEPSAIEAQLAATRRPYIEGDDFLFISIQGGLICPHPAPPRRPCHDYRVRFCCQQPVRRQPAPLPPLPSGGQPPPPSGNQERPPPPPDGQPNSLNPPPPPSRNSQTSSNLPDSRSSGQNSALPNSNINTGTSSRTNGPPSMPRPAGGPPRTSGGPPRSSGGPRPRRPPPPRRP